MKLQHLIPTALLLITGSASANLNANAIAAPLSTSLDDTARPTVSSVATDETANYQKQRSERDRQRQEELRRRERERQREAEQRRRDRDDDRDDDDDDDDAPWWEDDRDDDAPWWSSDEGWEDRDRERQRDARQREQDRRDLEERLEDRRDRDRDDDYDYDDYDNDDRDDDFWRQWERQRELLQWQWNNWRSSLPSSFASSTQVDFTSLGQDAVTVAIDSINGEQALTFAGNNTQQSINLAPGTYKMQFVSREGDRVWQSGYLNVGRTDTLRIVFDPRQYTVQVYNDPYAWTPDSRNVSSYQY
jgi:hypothetical protein